MRFWPALLLTMGALALALYQMLAPARAGELSFKQRILLDPGESITVACETDVTQRIFADSADILITCERVSVPTVTPGTPRKVEQGERDKVATSVAVERGK